MRRPLTQRQLPRNRLIKSFMVLAGTLGIALVGAILTGSELSTVTQGVESASASSGNLLGNIGSFFPLGFAFSAGMVSSVNPCGFAMLPAYLGLFLGDPSGQEAGLPSRIQRASLVSAVVTAGFVFVFVVIGVPIGLGARKLVDAFPWIGLSIGLLLAIVGAHLLRGGTLYNNLGVQLSARMIKADGNNLVSYLLFGIGYGIASLSCTLPIFLAVIGGTFTADTFFGSLLQFLLYGLGMGFVILSLTTGIAIFNITVVKGLRLALPYVNTLSAALLLVSGGFIVYYWLTLGELLAIIQGAL